MAFSSRDSKVVISLVVREKLLSINLMFLLYIKENLQGYTEKDKKIPPLLERDLSEV